MKILIVPPELIEKLTFPRVDGFDTIEPQKGNLNGQDVYFLPESLKTVKKFDKLLADFEVCEIKDIATIETKMFTSKGIETIDISKMTTSKTILTETIIKEINPIITK